MISENIKCGDKTFARSALCFEATAEGSMHSESMDHTYGKSGCWQTQKNYCLKTSGGPQGSVFCQALLEVDEKGWEAYVLRKANRRA